MQIPFWISVFLFLYTFAGYPFAIYLVSSRRKRKDLKFSGTHPTVEIIIVVRNAEDLVADKIETIEALIYPKNKISTTFISDCSTDSTVANIKRAKNSNVKIIANEFKSTKSACLNSAIMDSKADILFLTDIRQSLDPDCVIKLITHFDDDSVGAVSGELILNNTNNSGFGEGMDAYWRYEKFIRYHESIVDSVPGVTGAVYALRRKYFKEIPSETLLDDVLIPMNLILAGKKVLFEPEAIAYDISSCDLQREKIRKTRTLAGNWQLLQLEPQLLNPFRNRIWLQFVSHKILRLIAPFLLIIILFSSFWEAFNSLMYLSFFLIQLAGYFVLLLALRFNLLLKIGIIRMAYSFVSLMYFTLLGFMYFFSGKHLELWSA